MIIMIWSGVWFIRIFPDFRIFCDQNFRNFIDFQPDFVCFSPILRYFSGFFYYFQDFSWKANHTPVWCNFICTKSQPKGRITMYNIVRGGEQYDQKQSFKYNNRQQRNKAQLGSRQAQMEIGSKKSNWEFAVDQLHIIWDWTTSIY